MTVAIAWPYSAGNSPAVSDLADKIMAPTNKITNSDQHTSEEESFIGALSALNTLLNAYSEGNWDGYGAMPISKTAYEEAVQCIIMLRIDLLPMPEISPEIDGGIEFEWYSRRESQFSISFDGKNTLVYSGIFENNAETFGIEPFDDTIPPSIKGCILRVEPQYWDISPSGPNRV